MNFDLSDDQRMLKDSVDRLVAARYSLDQRRTYMGQEPGWSRTIWNEIVELGLTLLPFGEDQGGLGLGGVEVMLVGEAFGRGLVVEPYLSSIVLAGTALAHAGGARAEALLAGVMTGETIAALADRAELRLEEGRLSGRATTVLGANGADLLIVADGGDAWLVAGDAEGLSMRGYHLHGGGSAADLILDGVVVNPDDRIDVAAVIRAREAGIAYLAAEAAGAMQAALDETVAYLKTREQFGKPIGTNQALQHRAAEMQVEVEQARSAAIYAALLWDEADADMRARGMAAVKAVIGKTGRFVGQSAVQLHGGIGVSEEHVVSHWFRRLTAIGLLLGSTDEQVKALAAMGGFTGAEPHLAA